MNRVTISSSGEGDVVVDVGGLLRTLLDVPDAFRKVMFQHDSGNGEGGSNSPVDIVDTPKELIMYMDVPGLSKADIQVTVEDEKLLVVRSKSNGKRKREENDECKYLRLERMRRMRPVMRKFQLPDQCNMSGISARCENGVLTVVVEKLPPTKSKAVQVAIS